MKKILFLALILFISTEAFSIYQPYDTKNCPTTNCPSGTFMGDDGKCYGCKESQSIPVNCIGHDKVFQACPNRFTMWGCGRATSLSSERKCYGSELLYFFPFLKLLHRRYNEVNFNNNTCEFGMIIC